MPLRPKRLAPCLLIEPLWNWNARFDNALSFAAFTFNRTTMELKHMSDRAWRANRVAFNRTTMELKHDNVVVSHVPFFLLIEPLWNWNMSSNVFLTIRSVLLIEPLWNWNVVPPAAFIFTFFLLIEPLWNWNSDRYPVAPPVWFLLIEPLWNWNLIALMNLSWLLCLLIEPLWNWNEEVDLAPGVKATF